MQRSFCHANGRISFCSLVSSRPSLQLRCASISTATSPNTLSQQSSQPFSELGSTGPDAKLEVLGAPFSLLSASLAASQPLYTRQGTLVGLSGKAENVISRLTSLEPLRRMALGIPFLYQKIYSTSPVTALISTKSPMSSFFLLHLDGTVDWMVAQRRALLAWTGETVSIRPTINFQMSLAHWGNSLVTGRGALALVGRGQIYQIILRPGEEYIAHPSNLIAYTVTKNQPLPFRFKSTSFKFQVPDINFSRFWSNTKPVRMIKSSQTWNVLSKLMFALRTWSRRTIFGDRLFLRFSGPNTIILQTQASRLSDVLTAREVNEIAQTPPGAIGSAIGRDLANAKQESEPTKSRPESVPPSLSYASVGDDGQVKFQKS